MLCAKKMCMMAWMDWKHDVRSLGTVSKAQTLMVIEMSFLKSELERMRARRGRSKKAKPMTKWAAGQVGYAIAIPQDWAQEQNAHCLEQHRCDVDTKGIGE